MLIGIITALGIAIPAIAAAVVSVIQAGKAKEHADRAEKANNS